MFVVICRTNSTVDILVHKWLHSRSTDLLVITNLIFERSFFDFETPSGKSLTAVGQSLSFFRPDLPTFVLKPASNSWLNQDRENFYIKKKAVVLGWSLSFSTNMSAVIQYWSTILSARWLFYYMISDTFTRIAYKDWIVCVEKIFKNVREKKILLHTHIYIYTDGEEKMNSGIDFNLIFAYH